MNVFFDSCPTLFDVVDDEPRGMDEVWKLPVLIVDLVPAVPSHCLPQGCDRHLKLLPELGTYLEPIYLIDRLQEILHELKPIIVEPAEGVIGSS